MIPQIPRSARFVDGEHRPLPDGDCRLIAVGSEMQLVSAPGRTLLATRLGQKPASRLGVPLAGTGLLRLHEQSAEGKWTLMSLPKLWVSPYYAVSRTQSGEFRVVTVESRGPGRWKLTEATFRPGGERTEWDARERECNGPIASSLDHLFWEQRIDGPCPWVITDQGVAFALR